MAGGATSVGVFRAGQKRPEVVVPALTLFVDSQQCSQVLLRAFHVLSPQDACIALSRESDDFDIGPRCSAAKITGEQLRRPLAYDPAMKSTLHA